MSKKQRFVADKKKNDFLNALLETGLRNKAAEIVGISRQTHYVWMKNDDEYAEKYEEVRLMLVDNLEDAAYERAVNGVERKVYFKGEEVGTQTEYSDQLLVVLLKANMPEKYKEINKVELSGNVGIADALKAAMERVQANDA